LTSRSTFCFLFLFSPLVLHPYLPETHPPGCQFQEPPTHSTYWRLTWPALEAPWWSRSGIHR
jgi:hypothetical protein